MSAGLLLHRTGPAGPEVFVAHMGGPFWARKDERGWTVPKGEHAEDEDPRAAAVREFAEELGSAPPPGDLVELGTVRAGAKRITVFALEGDFDANFAFIQDIGRAFLDVYPRIVRRRMNLPFTAADTAQMLEWRGRYAEFNLVYDRGTLFGLKTGGNIDAILMSLPPLATWS